MIGLEKQYSLVKSARDGLRRNVFQSFPYEDTRIFKKRVDAKIGFHLIVCFKASVSIVQKVRHMKEVNFEYRERGLGRPTKRQRREIEELKKFLDK